MPSECGAAIRHGVSDIQIYHSLDPVTHQPSLVGLTAGRMRGKDSEGGGVHSGYFPSYTGLCKLDSSVFSAIFWGDIM